MNQAILFHLILNLLNTRQENAGNTYNVSDGEDDYDANKIGKNETEIIILLKHLINFQRTFNISLINCDCEIDFNLVKNCVLADLTRRNAQGDNLAIVPPRGLEFKLKETKLCVPVLTLSK